MNAAGISFVVGLVLLGCIAVIHELLLIRRRTVEFNDHKLVLAADREREDMQRSFADFSWRR